MPTTHVSIEKTTPEACVSTSWHSVCSVSVSNVFFVCFCVSGACRHRAFGASTNISPHSTPACRSHSPDARLAVCDALVTAQRPRERMEMETANECRRRDFFLQRTRAPPGTCGMCVCVLVISLFACANTPHTFYTFSRRDIRAPIQRHAHTETHTTQFPHETRNRLNTNK